MMSTATIEGEWVLVVDDDEECLTLVAALLTRVGLEVRVARSGTRALEAVRLGRPLAVILEVRLPGVSGYELCHELRDRFGAELPIVFLSGTRVEPHDRTVGILAGADDYVVKPFDPNELLARVRRLAARARRARRPTTGYDLT